MDSRKSELDVFFKQAQPDAEKTSVSEYFKKFLSSEEINKLFQDKEISFIKINYFKHREYQKGDVISNHDGMSFMTLEFSDGTSESIRWKNPKIESVGSVRPSISHSKSD